MGTARQGGESLLSRRSILAAAPLVLSFFGGAAASWGVAGGFATRPAETAGQDGSGGTPPRTERQQQVRRGTVEWALWMQRAPDEDLLAAAGELERVRMRSKGDRRLVPVFLTVFEAALRTEDPVADQAGAIAVRCLDRLDAGHHLEVLSGRIDERSERPTTLEALRKALQRNRTGSGR